MSSNSKGLSCFIKIKKGNLNQSKGNLINLLMKDYDYPKNTLLDLIKKGFKSLYFANKVANNGVLF